MLCVLKTIIAWVILMLISTNLIGLIVRGLFWLPPSIDETAERAHEVLRRESLRMNNVNKVMTFFSIVCAATYLFALFYFWNIGLAVAGGIVMISRIPDLIWEIRNGKKRTRINRPKGIVYFVASTLLWGSLLLVWYSLCSGRLN